MGMARWASCGFALDELAVTSNAMMQAFAEGSFAVEDEGAACRDSAAGPGRRRESPLRQILRRASASPSANRGGKAKVAPLAVIDDDAVGLGVVARAQRPRLGLLRDAAELEGVVIAALLSSAMDGDFV